VISAMAVMPGCLNINMISSLLFRQKELSDSGRGSRMSGHQNSKNRRSSALPADPRKNFRFPNWGAISAPNAGRHWRQQACNSNVTRNQKRRSELPTPEYRRQCQRMGCTNLLDLKQMRRRAKFCSDACRQADGREMRKLFSPRFCEKCHRELLGRE